MRIKPEIAAEFRRVIRDARAKDPLITIGRLHALLEAKYQRGFSYQYVARLSEKVAREALIEVDRAQIEPRMAFARENYRIARESLMRIVCWAPNSDDPGERPPGHFTIIEAAKNLVMLDLALLKAEIETGVYKKEPTAIAHEIRYDPLPEEVRTVIIASWKRGGLLPATTIEAMVPELKTPALQPGPQTL